MSLQQHVYAAAAGRSGLPTFLQNSSFSNDNINTNNLTLTLSIALPAGTVLVLGVMIGGSSAITPPTISDSVGGGSWTTVVNQGGNNGASYGLSQISTRYLSTGSSINATVTCNTPTTGVHTSLNLIAFQGSSGFTAPVTGSNLVTGLSGSGSSNYASPSISTNAADLLISTAGQGTNQPSAFLDPTNGWTAEGSINGMAVLFSPGGSQSAPWTHNNFAGYTASWVCICALRGW